MTYRGHIKNGVAVLETTVNLPDGTPVQIVIDRIDADFRRGKSVEELAREQGVTRIRSLDDLTGDWPEDDSIDEFLGLIRAARK